jgi:23S rRNA (cytidine1920-2'-O)/16S rRNA (cytidine1409-2'-O)-methyltransferase
MAAENRRDRAAVAANPSKMRLDRYLVAQGWVASRKRAQALIMAQKVYVDGRPQTKAGAAVRAGQTVELVRPDHPYVSRGGLKLARVLETRPELFSGLQVIDVGASTGGFTDCLLQHGAKAVIAVDVGYGQLHWKLRRDARVTVIERTNARYLEAAQLPYVPQGAVIDVSFISLAIVLPKVAALVQPADPEARLEGSHTVPDKPPLGAPRKAPLVALVKPQFELDRDAVGKKGVVRDPGKHRAAVEKVLAVCDRLDLEVEDVLESPITGPKGNHEFLVVAGKPKRGAMTGDDGDDGG